MVMNPEISSSFAEDSLVNLLYPAEDSSVDSNEATSSSFYLTEENSSSIDKLNTAATKTKCKKVICPKCGRWFNNNYLLNRHIRIHENNRKHKCSTCPKAFVTLGDLKKHLALHSDVNSYKCSVAKCDKSFNTHAKRKLHEDCHGLNNYKCRYCDETFKRSHHRSNHQTINHKEQQKVGDNGEVEFVCSYCIKSFATVEFKEKHEASVHKFKSSESTIDPDKMVVKCPVCSEKFKRFKEFRIHVTIEHPDKFDDIFYTICKICDKKISKRYFNYHSMTHNDSKPNSCHICSKKLARKAELKTHMGIHNTDNAYQCDTCDKSFKNIRNLKNHKLNQDTCNDEKQLCEHCGVTFQNARVLKKHILSYKRKS